MSGTKVTPPGNSAPEEIVRVAFTRDELDALILALNVALGGLRAYEQVPDKDMRSAAGRMQIRLAALRKKLETARAQEGGGSPS